MPKGRYFRDTPARSGQAAPIPPAKGRFPRSPHSRSEGEPLKKRGCLSHFSETPDVM